MSGRRSSGPCWRTIRQHFQAYAGENNRTIDSLMSRFKTICLDCERFETIHTAVELEGGDLGEDNIIQVALINFWRVYHCEFKLRYAWKIIRFFYLNHVFFSFVLLFYVVFFIYFSVMYVFNY
ncbi:hypothetical protein Hanom_Chr12g01082591 [Helianthus anomalus]